MIGTSERTRGRPGPKPALPPSPAPRPASSYRASRRLHYGEPHRRLAAPRARRLLLLHLLILLLLLLRRRRRRTSAARADTGGTAGQEGGERGCVGRSRTLYGLVSERCAAMRRRDAQLRPVPSHATKENENLAHAHASGPSACCPATPAALASSTAADDAAASCVAAASPSWAALLSARAKNASFS